MRLRALKMLLTFTMVGGFAYGGASAIACHGKHHQARRQAFEDHIATVCVRAAQAESSEQAADLRPSLVYPSEWSGRSNWRSHARRDTPPQAARSCGGR